MTRGALLLAIVVALGAGCQILGISPIPCDGADVRQCPDADTCVDGVCVPKPKVKKKEPLPEEGPIVAVDDGCAAVPGTGASTIVDIGVSGNHGQSGLREAPMLPFVTKFSASPDCAPALAAECGLANPQTLGQVLQPFVSAGETQERRVHLLAQNTQASNFPKQSDLQGVFVVEAVFRSPSPQGGVGGGQSRVVTSYADPSGQLPDRGWSLQTDTSGALEFRAMGVHIDIRPADLERWMHVLCAVDTDGLIRGVPPEEAVFCALDGEAAGEAHDGTRAGFVEGRLFVGGGLPGVPVSVVNVFTDVDVPKELIARRDTLLDVARRRLLTFVGISLTGPVRVLAISESELDPSLAPVDAKLFSVLPGNRQLLGAGYVRVGTHWPRIEIDPGEDTAALLLEPARANLLLVPLVVGCATLDRRDEPVDPPAGAACLLRDVEQDFAVDALSVGSANVATGALTFSTYVRDDADAVAAALGVTFDTSFGPVTCDLHGVGDCGGDAHATLDFDAEDAGSFRRAVVRLQLAEGTETLSSVHLSAQDIVVWSPQLEQGGEPTTPMAVDPEAAQEQHPSDTMFLDLVGAGAAPGVSIDATVVGVPPTPGVAPFLFADDLDLTDGFGGVVMFQGGNQIGVDAALLLNGGQDVDPSGDTQSEDLTGSVHLAVSFGDAAEPCTSCLSSVRQTPYPAYDVHHLWINAGGEPFGASQITYRTTAGGEVFARHLDLRVEPRTVGCLGGAHAAFDASDKGTSDKYAARDGKEWFDSAPERVLGPAVGELALIGSGSRGGLHVPVGADQQLVFEVRVRADAPGHVLSLDTDDDDDAASVDVDEDGVLVTIGDASGTLAVPAGAWVHLTCWVAQSEARCLRNLAALRSEGMFDDAGPVRDPDGTLALDDGLGATNVTRVRFSSDAGPVSVVRGFALATTLAGDDGLVAAQVRAARSFGFHPALRRRLVTASTLYSASAILERRFEDKRLPFLVSAGWPQVVNAGTPAFLTESALDDVLPDELDQWVGGGGLDVDVGPLAALEARELVDNAPISYTAELGGIVSVYARAVSGHPHVTLSVGAGGAPTQAREVDLDDPDFDPTAFDAGDGWVRLAVQSDPNDDLVGIAASGGTVAISAPQHDPTGTLTAPLVAGGARRNSPLALIAGDIGAGVHLGTFTFDADIYGDGAIASLLTALSDDNGPFFQGMQVSAAGETMTVQTVLTAIDLSASSILTARPFENVGRVSPLVVAWRDFDVLVQTKAQLQHRFLVPPVVSPVLILLGGYEEGDAVVLEVHSVAAEDEARADPLEDQ